MEIMLRDRVVPLFVYRTAPVVVITPYRGKDPSVWRLTGRLGKRGAGGPMGTAVAAPVRLSVRRGDEAVVEDLHWPSGVPVPASRVKELVDAAARGIAGGSFA